MDREQQPVPELIDQLIIAAFFSQARALQVLRLVLLVKGVIHKVPWPTRRIA